MKRLTPNLKYLIKYALIGILNTVVSYLIYGAALLLGLKYSTALVLAYLTAMTHSYAWNRFWNFRSRSSFGAETIRFVSVYVTSFLINLLILRALIENHFAQPFIAQAASIAFTAPATFLMMRYWVFKKIK